MIKYLYFLLMSALLIVACSGNAQQENKKAKATIVNSSKIKILPDLPPIYENFEDLAPIFNQQNDTTYVINFWATWCAPCVKELPYFEAFHKKYKSEKVKVVLVSLDFSKQLDTKLKPFLIENKLQSEVLVLIDPDANSWVDKVDPSWSGAIPATVIYKGEKKTFFEQSFENLEELEAEVLPFF